MLENRKKLNLFENNYNMLQKQLGSYLFDIFVRSTANLFLSFLKHTNV